MQNPAPVLDPPNAGQPGLKRDLGTSELSSTFLSVDTTTVIESSTPAVVVVVAGNNTPSELANQPTESTEDREHVVQIIKALTLFTKSRTSNAEIDRYKLLLEMNKNLKDIENQKKQLESLQKDNFIIIIRDLLLDKDSNPRKEACKFLRKLMGKNTILLDKYKQLKIHILIARNIEKDMRSKANGYTKSIEEVTQYVKFIKSWIKIAPASFPLVLAKSLTSLMLSSDEATRKFTLEIIRTLSKVNPEITQYAGGFKVLIEACTDPLFEKHSSFFVESVISALHSPESRDIILDTLQIPKIFSNFTDIARAESAAKKEDPTVVETRLRLASNTILIFFKNWSGLIYFGNEKYSLKSLVETLRQPIKQNVRESVFQLIEHILKVGVSLCPTENGFSNCVMKRSLAQLAYIQTILLQDAGLYDVLLELSAVDSQEVSNKALTYLKMFSHMMYNLLPHDEVQKPDFLMNSINLNQAQFDYLRSKCSTIFENMNTKLIKRMSNQSKVKNEFMSRCEYFYLNIPFFFADTRFNREVVDKLNTMDQKNMDAQRRANCVRNVLKAKDLSATPQIFLDIIYVLETTKHDNFQELCENNFFIHLVKFYLPSQRTFNDLPWRVENFPMAKAGYLLIKLLLKSPYGRKMLTNQLSMNYFMINRSFLDEYKSMIEQDLKRYRMLKNQLTSSQGVGKELPSARHGTNPVSNSNGPTQSTGAVPILQDDAPLKFENFSTTMVREHFSWLGLFTSSKDTMILLQEAEIFETLKQMIKKSGYRDHLLRTVLLSLNYQWSLTRSFLLACLENGSPGLQITCLTIINLLQISEHLDYTWVKDLLLKQLSSRNDGVVDAALSTIEKIALTDELLAQLLAGCDIYVSKKTHKLLMRYLRTEQGFDYLYSAGWVQQQMEEWKNTEMTRYLENFERKWVEHLDSSLGDGQDYDYKFISHHTESNPAFAKSPLYVNSLLRMPWNINCTLQTAKGKVERKLNIYVDYNWTEEYLVVEGRTSDIDTHEIKKLMLNLASGADSNWNLTAQLKLGEVFLNDQCQQVTDPYSISIGRTMRDQIKVHEAIQSQRHYSNRKVEIIFFDDPDQIVKAVTIVIKIKLSENYQILGDYSHLCGSLACTEKGVGCLKNEQLGEKLFSNLIDPETKLQQKKVDLLALGNIGLHERGMNYLSKIDGLINTILDMASNSEHLPLRGLALNVINMFAQNSKGRSLIKERLWEAKLLKKNEFGEPEYIFMPPDLRSMMTITVSPSIQPFQLRTDYWDLYHKQTATIREQVDERGKEFMDLVLKITNKFQPPAKNFNIQDWLQGKETQILKNPKLFMFLWGLLTFYNYPSGVRKVLFSLVDSFLNMPNSLICIDTETEFSEFLKI